MNTIWKHMRCWEGKALATSATSSTGTSPSLPRLACNALHIFQGRRPDSLSRATRVAFGKGQPGQPPTTIQNLWGFGHSRGSFSLQLGSQFGKSFRRCYLSKKPSVIQNRNKNYLCYMPCRHACAPFERTSFSKQHKFPMCRGKLFSCPSMPFVASNCSCKIKIRHNQFWCLSSCDKLGSFRVCCQVVWFGILLTWLRLGARR